MAWFARCFIRQIRWHGVLLHGAREETLTTGGTQKLSKRLLKGPLHIRDIFWSCRMPYKSASKRRAYYLRRKRKRIRQGICIHCPAKPEHGRTACSECLEDARLRMKL